MYGKLILVRHGQSVFYGQIRFTGWKDVELTSQGQDEALNCADLLGSKTVSVTIPEG